MPSALLIIACPPRRYTLREMLFAMMRVSAPPACAFCRYDDAAAHMR